MNSNSMMMRGMAVFWIAIPVAAVRAQELVQSPPEYAQFELSNLRSERGVIGETIAFDYKQIRKGRGRPILRIRSDNGAVRISGFSPNIDRSGTIRLEDTLSNVRGSVGMEFYIVTSGEKIGFSLHDVLISNSVIHGSMTTSLSARPLNEYELEDLERERWIGIPPKTVPDGYTRATKQTTLVPGAPVLFGETGKWKEGVVVDFPRQNMVRLKQDGMSSLHLAILDQWIAVSDDTTAKIRQDPTQFSVEVRTLPNSNLILPDDWQPVVDPTTLVKGTPLKFDGGAGWKDGFFISSDQSTVQLAVRNGRRLQPKSELITRVAISDEVQRERKLPGIQDRFAANLEGLEDAPVEVRPSETSRADQPPGSMAVPSAAASFPAPNPAPDVPAYSPVRNWSDLSGKFKVDAQLIRTVDGTVVLKRGDGREIQVPIERLSESDREFLKRAEELSQPRDLASPMQPITRISELQWGAKSLAISPDNRFLLIGRSAASASLCEIATGKTLIDSGRMDHMGDVTVVGFTPDGKHALLGGYKGVIDVYSVNANGKMDPVKQFAGHTKEITALSFSPDSRFALTGDNNKTAYYWEIATGNVVATIDLFERSVRATHITTDGKKLMTCDGRTLMVHDAASGKAEREVSLGRGSSDAVAFSPNGSLLVLGDGYDFHLWNLETFTELPLVKGNASTWTLAFAPDNRHFISGNNGVLNVWDAKTQRRIRSQVVGESFYVQALAVSSNGSLVACPSDHRSVTVLKVHDSN